MGSILRLATLCAVALALVAAVADEAHAKKAAAGRPAFKADDGEAFWIWSDENGWHLRATTPKAKSHKFHGVIRSQGISQVKATRPGLTSKLETADTSIRFEFELKEGGEGFDFHTGAPCITLELKIDDKPQPAAIHIGAKAESPTVMPFDACQ